jgi:hypothetical protein
VWSVNASGILSKDGFAELHTLCVSLKSRSVDAIAIQEPNTDFLKADIREQYTKIFNEHFGQARVLMATSCIDPPRAWKPGGGGNPGNCRQHVSKVSRDDLGRWVSATLTSSDGDSLTVFSVYNVVDVKLQDAGPSTVFSQQYRLLKLAGVTHPRPRQQCVDDLNREIVKLVKNRETVAVLGDFIEALGRDPRLMASV